MAAAAMRVTGGRGRRRRRGLMAEINVTPFVDVMLVLLIIFMVTAPLLTAGVPVELPKTEAKPLPADKTPLTITVTQAGAVYLQETPVELDALLPRLEAVAQAGYQQRIFIRADSGAQYGKVAEVMARIHAAGYRNLGLVTDQLPKAAEEKE
ncbi:MAG: protein TolR [Hyphomonadaceae bacterium]